MTFLKIGDALATKAPFWAVLARVSASSGGRPYFTWEEWDRLFGVAEQGVLPVCIVRALERSHAEIEDAKKRGLSPWQFQQEQDRRRQADEVRAARRAASQREVVAKDERVFFERLKAEELVKLRARAAAREEFDRERPAHRAVRR